MTCDRFPGVWSEAPPGGTARVYYPCTCEACSRDWPCPETLRAMDVVEVASSQGVFLAMVVGVKHEYPGAFEFDIASDDGAAPEYLRNRVHAHWWVTRRSALWRVFDPAHRWSAAPILTRYDREVL